MNSKYIRNINNIYTNAYMGYYVIDAHIVLNHDISK